jgi:DNA-binding MarR family transcriptional regulator
VKEQRVIVTLRQREVLAFLARRHQVTVGEIASHFGVSSAAATKNVQRLEQKKLVRRVVDEWDRRRILVSLTSAGRSVFQEPTA